MPSIVLVRTSWAGNCALGDPLASVDGTIKYQAPSLTTQIWLISLRPAR